MQTEKSEQKQGLDIILNSLEDSLRGYLPWFSPPYEIRRDGPCRGETASPNGTHGCHWSHGWKCQDRTSLSMHSIQWSEPGNSHAWWKDLGHRSLLLCKLQIKEQRLCQNLWDHQDSVLKCCMNLHWIFEILGTALAPHLAEKSPWKSCWWGESHIPIPHSIFLALWPCEAWGNPGWAVARPCRRVARSPLRHPGMYTGICSCSGMIHRCDTHFLRTRRGRPLELDKSERWLAPRYRWRMMIIIMRISLQFKVY